MTFHKSKDSLHRRLRTDAALALTNRWSMPFFSVFSWLSGLFLLVLIPEGVQYFLLGLLPEHLQQIALPVSAGCVALLGLVLFFLLAPLSLGMDHFYDRLTIGKPAEPDCVFSVFEHRAWAARKLKARVWGRCSLILAGGILLGMFFSLASEFFFSPKAVLSDFPKDAPFLEGLEQIGVQPLAGVICLVLLVLSLLLALWLAFYSTIPGWLAPTLLLEGKAKTPAQALQLSRRILTPHRHLLASFLGGWFLPLLSCVFILPIFAVIPRYAAGKALLCRYCLSPAGNASADESADVLLL